MNHRIAFVLLLLLAAPLASAANVDPALDDKPLALDPSRVTWWKLNFEASKLFVTARTSAQLDVESGGSARLTLRSEALGRVNETRLVFDAKTAAAKSEERLKVSDEAELRSFHYGSRAATKIWYHEETKAKADLPIERWREKGREERPYGPAGRGVAVATPSSLLYVIAASSLDKPGDRIFVPIFTKGQLVAAEAEVVERTTVDAPKVHGAPTPAEEIPVLRVRVGGRSPDGGEIDLDLFGLEGDLEILLDPLHRLPVSIRGEMSILGTVDVELKEAWIDRSVG